MIGLFKIDLHAVYADLDPLKFVSLNILQSQGPSLDTQNLIQQLIRDPVLEQKLQSIFQLCLKHVETYKLTY